MLKKNKKLVLIVLSLLLFTLFIFVGCSKKPTSTKELTVGIATWAGFGTGMVGMEKGFFGDIIVETKILDVSTARHSAFISGNIDIMISSVDLYAQEAAQKITGQVFLVTDESMGGDGIVVSDSIKTIEDLKGKKVAFNRGGPSDYLLYKALSDKGVGLDEIVQVEVDDPSKAGDAFLGGAVDAAVTWEPFLSQVVTSGKGRILLTTKDYPNIIVDILVASDKLAANEELLKRFMDGWLKSVDFIKANPTEAAIIMSKGLNLPVEDVEGMMAGLRYADRARNVYFFSSASPEQTKLAQIYNDASKYWKEAGIINSHAAVSGRISPIACKYFEAEP